MGDSLMFATFEYLKTHESINVSAICKLAHLSRSSFYKKYSNADVFMRDFIKKHRESFESLFDGVIPCEDFDKHLTQSMTLLYRLLENGWAYYPSYLRFMLGKFHFNQYELIEKKLIPERFFSFMKQQDLENKRVFAAAGVEQYLVRNFADKKSMSDKTIAECVAFVKGVMDADLFENEAK